MIYILILISLYLVYFDIKHKRVPNTINIALFLIVLIYKIIFNENLLSSLLSGSAAFITFLLIHIISRGKMGMGDCKYTAIIAFNFGYLFWLQSIIYCSLFAIIISLTLLIFKKIDRTTPIPFVPFIVAGWILNYFLPLPIT